MFDQHTEFIIIHLSGSKLEMSAGRGEAGAAGLSIQLK